MKDTILWAIFPRCKFFLIVNPCISQNFPDLKFDDSNNLKSHIIHYLSFTVKNFILLFYVFTFSPQKYSQLPAFTSFHIIQVQKFVFCSRGAIHKNQESILPQIISNIWYECHFTQILCLHMSAWSQVVDKILVCINCHNIHNLFTVALH